MSAPHQKGRSTHVLASEQLVEGQMSKETTVALEERVGALEEGLASLREGQSETQATLSEISASMARLAEVKTEEHEEEEETEEEETEEVAASEAVAQNSAQMSQLEAQLAEQKSTIGSLTDALTRQAFMSSFPDGATIQLTEQNAEVFYQLSRRDPDGFKTLKATTKKDIKASNPVIPLFGNEGVTAFEVELGQAGAEPEVTEDNATAVYATALEEAGSDANAALEIFKKKMGYA